MLPSLHAILATAATSSLSSPTKPIPAPSHAVTKSATPTADSHPGNHQDMDISLDPAYDPSLMSPVALSTSAHHQSEISMVEKLQDVGVTFNPPLSSQRQQWALDMLRKEHVTSVLEIGCGPGELLRALCRPAATIPEKPIKERSIHENATSSNNHRHGRRSRKHAGKASSGKSTSRSRSRSRPRYGHRRRGSFSGDDDEDDGQDQDGESKRARVDEPKQKELELRELFLNVSVVGPSHRRDQENIQTKPTCSRTTSACGRS